MSTFNSSDNILLWWYSKLAAFGFDGIQISVPKAFQREISIEVFGTSGPECMKAVEPIAELLDLELLSFTPKKEFYENNTDESETVIINKDLKINEGILPSEQVKDENKDFLGEW